MDDPRLNRLATVLVNYSTGVKPGELVRLAGPPIARPLLVSLYRAVLEAGGHPHIQMTPDECEELRLTYGNRDQISFLDPLDMHAIENVDVSISVWGQDNTKALTQIDPSRQAMASQARRRLLAKFLERAAHGKLRWTGTQFPCHSAAQDAQMSLSAYETFVYDAGLLFCDDPAAAWREVSNRQQRMVNFLNGKRTVRFVTPQGTDLNVVCDGRIWRNCDGHENFPDGEVFTGPLENATEGVVQFSFPAVSRGREVEGVRLVFRAGKVVEATATKGQDFLLAMLDQDPGARILGEIALGTNYSVTEYTRNTLFDEKIGGTFHAALGAAYPETGGKNDSALHWDMVCDLRQGGQVFVDGQLISENGRFLDPTWPCPSAG